jgi:4-cresol dehydrogenase (hydroxylating) flavoprotein subunit
VSTNDVVDPSGPSDVAATIDGSDATLSAYARTTLPASTRPRGVVHPSSTAEIQQLVAFARREKVPLYPISGGKNWGYGCATAPRDGCLIVDLSRMNRILEVNESLGYAVVEPGVTQGALALQLEQHHPGLWMDANGAGPDTTLIGNFLERGFGHTPLGERCIQFGGLEVVLGTGECLQTGFGHYAGSKVTHVYRHGVGPSLEGLFFQSNYGIVTKLGIWLMPRPAAYRAFFCSATDAELPHLIERLSRLRRQGIVRSTVHVANALRVLTSRVSYPWDETKGRAPVTDATIRGWCARHGIGDWSGFGAVYGSAEVVRASMKTIRRELAPLRIRAVDDRRLRTLERVVGLLPRRWSVTTRLRNSLEALAPALGLLKGNQTDHYLRSAGWRSPMLTASTTSPHDNGAGLIWVAPTLPASSDNVDEVRRVVAEIYHRHGFDVPITFTFINERSLIATTNISFNQRDPDDVAAARACYREVNETLIARGYPPYRSGIGGFEYLHDGSTYWTTASRLKASLDPDEVISPGHYVG